MSSDSIERLPARIGGKYRPIRLVGKGGMSIVYEVEHDFTGDRLALKVLKGGATELDPAALARFRREARVSAAVKSEHIVRVVDADVAPELDGAPFLVMDLLEGADLGEHTRGEPQAPAKVVGWLRQVARALDRAHALGIVHRDLKPENLFLARQEDGPPVLKILDFGVAKVRAPDEVRHTVTGSVVGTPLYMSPEQARGQPDKIGPPADMWAIGMITYRLLTGRDYWVCESVSELLAKIVYEPVVPPSIDLGVAFDTWFLRSCHRAASQRWASVAEQVAELASALGVTLDASEPSDDVGLSPALIDRHEISLGKTVPHQAGLRDSLTQPASALSVSAATKPRQRARIAVIGIAVAAVVALSWTLILVSEPTQSAATSIAPAQAEPPPGVTVDEAASATPTSSGGSPSTSATVSSARVTAPKLPARAAPKASATKADPLADPH